MLRLLKRLLTVTLRLLRTLYFLSCRWIRHLARFLYRPWMTWRLLRLTELLTRWIRSL